MKRTLRIVAVAALFAAVIVCILQWVLNRGLTGYVQRVVLPRLESSLGCRLEVDRAEANLFCARLEVSGLRGRNAPGASEPVSFSAPAVRARIAPWSLLRGVLRASELKAGCVEVTLEAGRNAGATLGAFGRALQAAAPSRKTTATGQRASASLPADIRIDELELDGVLNLLERKADGTAAAFPVAVAIRGENLSSRESGKPGRFTATGHLAGDPASCVMDLRGTVGLHASTLPDFELSGSIKNIDLKTIEAMTRKSGVEGDGAEIAVKLACLKGLYQKGSSLKVRIRNARIRHGTAENATVITLPADFSLSIPVSGTADAPQLDITTGLIQGFLAGFAPSGQDATAEKNADALGLALKQLGKSLKKRK